MSIEIQTTSGATVQPGTEGGSWHLEIPAGPQGNYRLAQLDNYAPLQRAQFPHQPPLKMQLNARVSAAEIPGTWGFGFWNDPFSFSLGLGGGARRFPALPNAAWFFYASNQNYLSFRDDLPARGFIAQTFCSKHQPTLLLALGAAVFPLLRWPIIARKLRPFFRHLITEDSFKLDVEITSWQTYTLLWDKERIAFKINDQILETRVIPRGPLGLVIWIDNQFAAFTPDGKLSFGSLANPQPAWLEIESFSLSKG